VEKRWSTVPQAEECLNSLFFCALFEHTLSEKTGNPSKDDTKRPPLLTEYHGQGPLAAWLTLTLGNMIRDSLRTAKATLSIDERVEMESDGSTLSRIELAVAEDQREGIDRSRCIQMLRSGLDGAWEKLKPREQLSLILQTLMGVPPSVIARRVFNVHEGTITKYTTSGLTKIRDAIREYATVQRKLSQREIDGCFQFIRDAFSETDTLAGGLVTAASAGNKG
jgi:DNA-directed RNA polymerase specialized sigma24 family protein